ncbi:DMT family transporter [Sulfurospirillum arcachonense]|uniref:aromatic amino acid exporter YddG n=1 Tax=Sulfurospirillum arcachonense TaxID=57666 RepID=UPI00046AFD4B|nr:DMT family transporter [Sulfurospirillum arcachonense]
MQRGNLFGIVAILLWATLASFSVLAKNIPPFELTSMSFFVAFLIGVILWKKEGKGVLVHITWPLKVWIVGVSGLLGYQFFYFLAIQNAPAIEANLINYLWPLFIVLVSSFLPNEKLKWYHIIGVTLGLIGVVFLVSKGGSFNFEVQYLKGYIYAFICAVIWASYSVLSRLLGKVPTSAVGGFCGLTAVLSLACHLIFEITVIPNFMELIAILALGLGPVGGAFFVWDYGVKNGDIQFLGTLSYSIPLLSTLLLIVLGFSKPSSSIWLACFFIVSGSIISSLPQFKMLYNKLKKG